MTLLEYLSSLVAFDVPKGAIEAIALKRGVTLDSDADIIVEKIKELCLADLYVWFCTSPSKIGSKTEKDNNWSHTDGGFSLDKTDRSFLISLANDIYKKYDETLVGKSHIRMSSFGLGSGKMIIDR